jgi:hypothetical protein
MSITKTDSNTNTVHKGLNWIQRRRTRMRVIHAEKKKRKQKLMTKLVIAFFAVTSVAVLVAGGVLGNPILLGAGIAGLIFTCGAGISMNRPDGPSYLV